MPTDSELLRVYAETKSEEAFRELVLRHHRMVYFAALRKLGGDVHRAQEVAQDVFTDLGRKAAKLSRRPVINGWLYVSACYAAAKVARAAQRKRMAEEKAAAEAQLSAASHGEFDGTGLSPLVDEILLRLNARDREAVLLRFFEGLTFSEMGSKLRLSEDGARLRLDRAVDKMRSSLASQGVASSAAALSGILSSQAQAAAPAGLAGTLATGAFQQLSHSTLSAFCLPFMTKATVSTACAVVLIGTIPAVYLLRDHRLTSASPSAPAASVPAAHGTPRLHDAVHSTSNAVGVTAPISSSSRTASEPSSSAATDPKTALLSDLSRGVIRTEALANIGCATPRAAVESFLWAIVHGSNDDVAAMIGLTDRQKEKINAFLEGMPAETRVKYADPEHLVALFGAREGTIVPSSGTVEITSETLAASNEVKIVAHMSTSPEQHTALGLSPDNSSEFNVRNGPKGWKLIVPDYVVDQIVSQVVRGGNEGG